ncbi:MAG TPA: glycosyltransferase [Bacteroidota bacterium]|nr:glycosyltransferase [Bacteroidota bacterium]
MSIQKSSGENNPLVSIILCTYNRAHLVKRAIASVLVQTYRNWELIIIDDGSTDSTESVIFPLVKSDTRIVYLRHPNKGLAASRNVGMKLAHGEFITFLDSDDEYREDHLATRVTIMSKRPSVALLYGGIEYVGPEEKLYVPDARRPDKKIHLSKCYASGTFFARTATFRMLRGFRDIPFAEDFDFIQRLRKRGFTVAKVHQPTYRYHVDADHRLCDLFEAGGERAILAFRGV